MKPIILKGSIGEKEIVVEVSKPHGAAGNIYFVTMDNYHQGQIVCIKGEWTPYLHPTTILSSEDIQVILDTIKAAEKQIG